MKQYDEAQLESLRASGKILRGALSTLEKAALPGITTLELDKIAENYIRSSGGQPCFKGYNGYGFTICTSVNEESIHGIPRKDKVLKDGDIISIDCGVRYPKGKKGMCTDAARTFAVGSPCSEARKLIEACQRCFEVATKDLKAGDKIAVIGERIETFVDSRYGIIDTFFGHGIGEKVHEEPLIPNFNVQKAIERGDKRERLLNLVNIELIEGTAICIEPMINCGTKKVKTAKDGWTVVTEDGKLAAHFENTLIIHKDGVEIVT